MCVCVVPKICKINFNKSDLAGPSVLAVYYTLIFVVYIILCCYDIIEPVFKRRL